MESLSIWVNEESDNSNTKGLGGKTTKQVIEKISPEALTDSLKDVCGTLGNVFKNVKSVGDIPLKEVTIQVEISASGGVNLIGSAQMGGKGAITLKFADE